MNFEGLLEGGLDGCLDKSDGTWEVKQKRLTII